MDENTNLVQLFIEDYARGKSFYDLEAKHGVPAAEISVMIDEYLANNYLSRDRQRWQQLLTLRIERITDHLWDGIEQGSFKHAEAVVRLMEKLAELLALNEQAIVEQDSKVNDAQTELILRVLRIHDQQLLELVRSLPLSVEAKEKLDEWPEWVAETSTNAVEQVIYAEIEEKK